MSIAALARAQAAEGVIPAAAARLIGEHARAELIDLDYAAQQTRETSHSALGLIRAFQAALPARAQRVRLHRRHRAGHHRYLDLAGHSPDGRDRLARPAADRGPAADLAVAHRSTVMAGRTHGQAGSPVTFGWKAASWADEIRRHLDRMRDGAPRWLVGQLGGGVGSLVFYGPQGLAVRARFCAELGPGRPRSSPGCRPATAAPSSPRCWR